MTAGNEGPPSTGGAWGKVGKEAEEDICTSIVRGREVLLCTDSKPIIIASTRGAIAL